MAHCGQKSTRLTRFACYFIVLGLSAIFCMPQGYSRDRYAKKHFLSWESSRRPEQYRRLTKKMKSAKHFKVSRDRVAKLKKSSFWNSRPYQFSTPLVSNDKIYVGADSGFFYAIDAKRESRVWKFKTEGPVQSKAAMLDDTVYFGDTKTFVYALDAATGKEKWRTQLDAEILATPFATVSRLYVADMSGRLYALDRMSGSQVWHTEQSDRSVGFSVRRAASPVVYGGLIFLGTASGNLIAYSEDAGKLVWSRQLGEKQSQTYDVDSTPLVLDGKLYAASADNHLFCLDAKSGQVIWSVEAGGVNDVIEYKGRIYASGGGVLSAVNPQDGSIIWQQDLETPEISSPVAGDNYIAIVSTIDKFYLIDSETGDIGYERYVRGGSYGDPVILDGSLYLLSNSSRLFSFKIRELPAKKK